MSLSVDEVWGVDDSSGGGGGSVLQHCGQEASHGIVSLVEEGGAREGCGLCYVTSYTSKELNL